MPKISRPANDALLRAGYTSLGQLAGVPAADLLQLHGLGPRGIRILQAALEERGLTLT
ncbi:MAG: DNA-binding protein [Streptosporangiales bacterium]|nr:DNA-binding protein [Streptosporangiales bacterium]